MVLDGASSPLRQFKANHSKIKALSKQENQPQKLALFIHKIDTYGVGRVVLNLAKEFAALGWHIDLVVSEDRGEHQAILSGQIRIVQLKTLRAASSPSIKGVLEFSQYLKIAKPKAVLSFLHYNNEIAILAKYLAKEPVKIIVSDHSALSKVTAEAARKTRKLVPLIARFLYPFADGIVAVSQAVKDDLSVLLGLRGCLKSLLESLWRLTLRRNNEISFKAFALKRCSRLFKHALRGYLETPK